MKTFRWLLALAALSACTRSLHPPEADPLAKVPALSAPVEAQSLSEEWLQDTRADFEGGSLEGTQITDVAGGEVTLAPGQVQGLYVSTVHAVNLELTAVGAEWHAQLPEGSDLRLEVRTSHDGQGWIAWQELPPDPDDEQEDPGVQGTRLASVPRGRFFQYRLTLSGPDPARPPVLERVLFFFLNTSTGPTLAQAQSVLVPKAAIIGVPQPDVISRGGWGADESLLDWEPEYRPVKKIIIHHTAMDMSHLEPAAAVRAIYTYHARNRGWGDVGYNYLVDWLGNVYEGRAGGEGVAGGHNLEFNYGSVGIALLGDFSRGAPSQAQMQALASLVSYEADRWGIDPQGASDFLSARAMPNVSGHRDTRRTSCPGDGLYNQLPALRQQVWQRMLLFPPRVELKGLPEDGPVSGAIELQVESTSPHLESLNLSLDGRLLAEGQSPLKVSLNTAELTDAEHRLVAVAVSKGGQSQTVERVLRSDNQGPTGALLINGGAPATKERKVKLTFDARDPSGVAAVAVANGEADPAEFRDFTSELEWELPEGEGTHRVRARFRDTLGHTSSVVEASIVLDTTPPGDWGTLVLRGATLQIGVTDALSGLDTDGARYGYSTDGGQSWSEWAPAQLTGEEGTTDPQTVIVVDPIPAGKLRLEVADRAGNAGQSPVLDSPGILTPTPAPSPTLAPSPTPTPVPSPTPTATPSATATLQPTGSPTPGGTAGPTPEGTATATPSATPTPASESQGGQPDLLVLGLEVDPLQPAAGQPVRLAVQVTNQGSAASPGFWVQVCADPPVVPRVNYVCSVGASGAYWFVEGLEPGQTVTLTESQVYPAYSNFPGFFLPGRHTLYAYADAYNTTGTLGLVAEASESNNLYGPLTIAIPGQPAPSSGLPSAAEDLWRELPPWLRLYLKDVLESLFPAPGG